MKKEKEKEKKKKKERRTEEYTAESGKETDQPICKAPPPAANETRSDADSLELLVGLVGGRWKMRILWALREGKGCRYSSIKSTMPTITDMMLSQSLRDLCAHGLVFRRPYQEIPPRVEYVITPEGAAIIPALDNLIGWAKQLPEHVVKGE